MSEMREERLVEIRREAQEKGLVAAPGIRASGSPLPMASPSTGYYGLPLLKAPQWTELVPPYFFLGGASGALGVIGSLADVLGGEEKLARKARWMALGGVGISSVLLIVDLGRPARFLNMLRVFKPQSVMSVGSWVLSAFSVSVAALTLADATTAIFGKRVLISLVSGAGRLGCVIFGMPLHNYTGVLLGATVIPVWNKRIKSLPRQFGMSGLQSAVSLLELSGEAGNRALNAIGVASACVETWEGAELLSTRERELKPAKEGATGAMILVAAALSGPIPLALRVASLFVKEPKRLRRMAAISGIAGSMLMRFGWVRAGSVSARDWKIPLGIDESAENTRQRN
jgi:hypothetical protein